MEDYRDRTIHEEQRLKSQYDPGADFGKPHSQTTASALRSRNDLIDRLLREKELKASRRKWSGRGLITLGSVTLLGSCPFYMLSLVGPWTMGAGLALIAAGSVLMAWTPKLKNTNEALLIASKHDNRLTAPRLALEMDISFEKAERIIRELVKAGIAEVDIDSRNPDQGIVYLIKGL